jgi:uncharacterized repeat protein (TIGR03847 family)
MSSSFHLPDPLHFTAGTVGPPGQRVFYLQMGDASELLTFKLEKQQVAALAEYLSGILADLPPLAHPLLPAPGLIEPVVPEWIVGGIGIAVDEASDRILLVVHELVPETEGDAEMAELLAELAGLELEDDDDDDDDDEGLEELDEDEFDDEFDEDDAATARVRLSRQQVAAFIERATELVEAGRPFCPFCGLPSNPDGHFCPRAN